MRKLLVLFIGVFLFSSTLFLQDLQKFIIEGGRIDCYFTTHTGDTYCGSPSGIWKMDKDSENWNRISGTSGLPTIAIWASADGNLILGGSDTGLYEFKGNVWKKRDEVPGEVMLFYEVNTDEVIVLNGSDLYMYTVSTGEIHLLRVGGVLELYYSLCKRKKGDLVAGGKKGKLFVKKPGNDEWEVEEVGTEYDVTKIVEDGNGDIYVATQGDGVYKKTETGWSKYSINLADAWISELFSASDGSLYVTTIFGIQKLENNNWGTPIPLEQRSNMINSITEHNGKMILGTDGSGHISFDFTNTTSEFVNSGFNSVTVHDIFKDGNNLLVAGDFGGVYYVQGNDPNVPAHPINTGLSTLYAQQLFRTPEGKVAVISCYSWHELGSGFQWATTDIQAKLEAETWMNKAVVSGSDTYLCTNKGMWVSAGESFSKYGDYTGNVNDFSQTPDGDYFATTSGGFFFNNIGEPAKQNIDNQEIKQFHFTADGILTLTNQGWEYIDINGYSPLSSHQLGDGSYAKGIGVNENHIIAASNNTVYEMNPEMTWAPLVKTEPEMNSLQKGLSSKLTGEINMLKFLDDSDKLYIGTSDGLYIYTLPEITGVDETNEIPETFELGQNYPNPFNPSTTISYSIAAAGNVNISVYNSLGEQVKVLVDENLPAGKYTINFNGMNLSSGVYYYKIRVNDFCETKKMLLLK